jgi:hypothetical protein
MKNILNMDKQRRFISISVSALVIAFSVFAIKANAQNILQTKPRLMYNYLLFTDTILDFKHLQSTLPDGARMQLTDDIAKVKRTELIQFIDRGDSVDRFWYVNNTIFTQCKLVVVQHKKVVEEILFWPNAESVEVEIKLLQTKKYTIKTLLGELVLEQREIEIATKN